MREQRLNQVLHCLEQQGLDALIVSHPANRFYLSGFTGGDLPPLDSAGHLIVASHGRWLVTDFRYKEQAEMECPGWQIVLRDGSLGGTVGDVLLQAGFKTVAFEAQHLIFSLFRTIQQRVGSDLQLVPTEGLVEQCRVVKDPQELELMGRAAAIADAALKEALRKLAPGITERAFARLLDNYMLDLGADRPAFETIVASGPRASLPHARPTDRSIQPHEPIIVDMGASLLGYHSDMTRTFFLGQPDAQSMKIYQIVLKAQQEAETGLRAGMIAREADALARNVIAAEGYGEYFGHGLGHGIGLEVHEAPRLSPRSEEILKPGSTATVEPGLYLPGWGGVRLENLVVLRDTGIEVLTGTILPSHGDVREVIG